MAASLREIFCTTVYEALDNIAGVLNIQKDTLIRSEKLAVCSFARSCSDSIFIDSFSHEQLEAWYAVFGDDLIIDVSIEEHNAHEQITCKDRSGLNHILDVISEFEIDIVDIQVTIKKEILKAKVRDYVHVPSIDALFFFEQTLVESLTLKRIQGMQEEGAFLPDQRTVIAVLTESGMLQGSLLTVFGLRSVSIEDFSSLPRIEPTVQAWHKALSLRDTTTIWATPLADIAPSTFQVVQIQVGLKATYEAMIGICNILSLLQFCVSVLEGDNKTWHVSIAHPGGPMIDISNNDLYRVSSTSSMSPSLYRLYRWAFQAESYDKIDIVRELIRHEIRDREIEPLYRLMASGSALLESARANYKILRKQAFEAYLHSRQEAIEAIQSFIVSTRKDLDTLRKDILETTLRFSAGIIAFLAADVLKLDLTKFVIATGFGLGLIYLILAAIFQLFPLWQQYGEQYKEAVQIVNAHDELTLTERNRLIGQLPSRTWSTFTKWFLACAIAYIIWGVILIGVLIYLFRISK